MRRYSIQIAILLLVTVASCLTALGQTTGRLKGVVRSSAGAPVPGAVVVVTNQVTRNARRVRSASDGSYSVQLPAGAYRINLDQPNTAQFDKDKNYGDFALVQRQQRLGS